MYTSMTYGAYITRRMLIRALVTSTIGTSIEFFDFGLYGLLAVTIGKTFFPAHNPLASTLAAFVTFGAGFAARPIGAAVFGHIGDRVGRKGALIVTLMLTGIATFLIGLVPSYAQIGIWGGIIVASLRVIQGLGLGGEWGGSVLLTVEWAGPGRRGFIGAWPQVGIPLGVALGSVSVLVSNALVRDPYWAWRLPFLASIVLVVVGLYLRLGVRETPVFTRLLEDRRIERRPVVEMLRKQWRDVVLICLMRAGDQAPALIFNTFILAYGTLVLKLPQATILRYGLFHTLLAAALIPLMGLASDVIGRKRIYLMGAAGMALWAFPFWALINTKDPVAMVIAFVGAALTWTAMCGPQAALFAETFAGRLRYSGASIGYQLSAITAGGPATIVATYLLSTFGTSSAIALYMIACVAVSFVATLVIRERFPPDLAVDQDDRSATRLPAIRSRY